MMASIIGDPASKKSNNKGRGNFAPNSKTSKADSVSSPFFNTLKSETDFNGTYTSLVDMVLDQEPQTEALVKDIEENPNQFCGTGGNMHMPILLYEFA
jgi:hypothetical protein